MEPKWESINNIHTYIGLIFNESVKIIQKGQTIISKNNSRIIRPNLENGGLILETLTKLTQNGSQMSV